MKSLALSVSAVKCSATLSLSLSVILFINFFVAQTAFGAEYDSSLPSAFGQIVYSSLYDSSGSTRLESQDLINYGVKTVFTNGNITGFEIEYDSKSLVLQLSNNQDSDIQGKLTITLPRSFIDAKDGTSDSQFAVLIDDESVGYNEISSSETERELEIAVPIDSAEIRIVGTRIIPEFPSSILVILTVAISSLLLINRMKHKINDKKG